MSYALYILLVSIFIAAKGLRCRMDQDEQTQEEFEDIVRSCLRQEDDSQQKGDHKNPNRNNNRGKGYDPNNQPGKISISAGKYGQDDKYNKDEEEYDYHEYENENYNDRNKNNQKGYYSQNNKPFQGFQNQDSKQQEDRRKQGSKNIGSPLESIEPCIIHCIFKQKKMLNHDNFIDKGNSIRVLTQKIRNPELKEFVEDSINECFEIIDNESKGKCEESKSFALCLEEKGKNNCEDWESPTDQKKGSGNGSSESNYNRPSRPPSNRGDRGGNRRPTGTNRRDDKRDDYFSRKQRGDGDKPKTEQENSNENTNNNYEGGSSMNEPKIKFSDYFQSGK